MFTDLALICIALALAVAAIVLYTRNPALEVEVRRLRRENRKMITVVMNLYNASAPRRAIDPVSADYAQTAETLLGTDFIEAHSYRHGKEITR